MRDSRKIIAFTHTNKIIDSYNSIVEAAKILFKGTRKAQQQIQKSCSGERKGSLLHPIHGHLFFKYE